MLGGLEQDLVDVAGFPITHGPRQQELTFVSESTR